MKVMEYRHRKSMNGNELPCGCFKAFTGEFIPCQNHIDRESRMPI